MLLGYLTGFLLLSPVKSKCSIRESFENQKKKIKVTVFLYRFRLHASSLPYMYVFAFYSFNVIDKPNFCFIQKITNKVIEIALNTDWIWRQVNGFLDSRFYSIYVLIVENQHSNIHTEERRKRERERGVTSIPKKFHHFIFWCCCWRAGDIFES